MCHDSNTPPEMTQVAFFPKSPRNILTIFTHNPRKDATLSMCALPHKPRLNTPS
jgi:hypothetical protein